MAEQRIIRELPLIVVLLVLLIGLLIVTYLDRWRVGSFVMGVALCFGAIFRLSLPPRQAGLLVVRSKAIDAAVLLVLGFALAILGNTIPTT